MLSFIAFFLVLGPLILLHELGHFVGAKLTGVRVEEFGLGWPPRLFKFWQSPSQLTVGSTPIVAPRSFDLPSDLQVGQHVDVVTGHEQENVYILEKLRVLDPESDDLTPKREPIEHSLPTHPTESDASSHHGIHIRGELTGLDRGTMYTMNGIPIGGFCRMTGEENPGDPKSLAAQPKRERLLVLAGGPVVNLIVAILLFTIAFVSGIPEPTDTYVVIADISPGSPAAEAQLQPEDVILKTGEENIQDVQGLIDYIDAHTGQTIVLTLEREGKVLEQPVWVRAGRPSDGRIGIHIVNRAHNFSIQRSSWPEGLKQGVEQFWFSFEQMLRLPAMLIQGQITAQEVRPLGPVGISQIAGDAIERSNEEQSWFTIIFFAGAISMALGITNLLPLPALDGGRILFVLIEAVRGRRIDPAKEGLVHMVGMVVLMGLLLIMTIQEIVNGVPSPF